MKQITLQSVRLSDVIMRLGSDETQVTATSSATDAGWGDTLGWNPIAVFKPTVGSAKEVAFQLEDFVRQQQEMDRLVIGYETYDFGCLLHGVPPTKTDSLGLPLVLAASFDSWLTFDKNGATVHSNGQLFASIIKKIMKRSLSPLPKKAYKNTLSPTQPRGWYENAYSQIKNYITDGDIYQVNLTHQLVGSTDLGGRDLFCLLHQSSQVDFQAYIEVDGYQIMSFSPERFVKIDGRSIETSPIKGTRERGSTTIKDKALQTDLLTSPKEQAELNMITDLLRNDLGQICEVGSVEVIEKRALKAYPTLWHAHSTIKGTLEPLISPIGALTSLMPGGSITGCPKKRAIEIIDELEATRRGIYTGSIFINRPDGALDSNIAIRTMIKNGDLLYLSVGGGIVNDSVEADEYQESIDKALSFINVNNQSERQTSSDILESQFGKTDIEIIHQDSNQRVICTKAIQSGKILEYSIVQFIKDGIDAFPRIHQEVLSGQSMGKAFTSVGIEFTRNTHDMYKFKLPGNIQKKFGSMLSSNVVDVTIELGPSKIPYARILETYSPDVVFADSNKKPTEEQLKKIEILSNFIR